MNAPILDADIRKALEPWDGIRKPKVGLLNISQHTVRQLLEAGSQSLDRWSNADANFLKVVAHQDRPLGRMQGAYFDQLASQYNQEVQS